MRDYGKVSPRFWNGKTGKALRGDPEAQLLALYLITSPHANMIGVFHCPVMYMAHETGLSEEGASEALQRLIEAQFCTFEGVEELVWVHEMACFQIAPSLSPKDKQCVGIARQYEQIPDRHIRHGFYERYKDAFHLPCCEEATPKRQAPSEPLRSQEQEQEQEQEKKEALGPQSSTSADNGKKPSVKRGQRLPADWKLPKAWGDWATKEQPSWTPEHVRKVAESFRDFWTAKPGRDAAKLDWEATWRVWVRKEPALRSVPAHQQKQTFAGVL